MNGGTTEPVWVLADPRPGTANQALGIAERLGAPFRVVPLGWSALARVPWPWPTLAGLDAGARARIAPPWPKLVISAGRRSAPVALWLGRRGVRTVHAMRPGFGASRFDLLVVGGHDRPAPVSNVLEIVGACHRVSAAVLERARGEWAELAALPAPRVAVLVGGPVRAEGLDRETASRLIPRVRRRFPEASLMVTTSRRTGTEATALIAAALADRPNHLFRWGDAGPNPYLGYLALADAIVVTGDSVSMLAEAAATAAPVFVATRERGRHERMIESLMTAGRVRPLRLAERPFAVTPLDEAARVAAAIRTRGLLD
ncbi:mitochondrial fission ELM1 family protein [Elioraea sp.]|uniref:mitochondrial fission ELM1 family protein n=1 Tax=Elioraea sp. TaxID=2185103 RepID=UPI003F6E9A41